MSVLRGRDPHPPERFSGAQAWYLPPVSWTEAALRAELSVFLLWCPRSEDLPHGPQHEDKGWAHADRESQRPPHGAACARPEPGRPLCRSPVRRAVEAQHTGRTAREQAAGWTLAGTLPSRAPPAGKGLLRVPQSLFLSFCHEPGTVGRMLAPESRVHGLIPRTCECDLVWKMGLCRCG